MSDEPIHPSEDDSARRTFLIGVSAVVTGGVVALLPVAAGFGVATDPLWRSRKGSGGGNEADDAEFLPICPLEAIPPDGVPRSFPVVADVVDAWTRAPNQRIGMVFLTHTTTPKGPNVTAFNAECPHLGCFIDFDKADDIFECPCHKSGFAKDGEKLFGPSRRGLDQLDVKLETKDGQTQVSVAFQKFQKGIAERKAAE